MMILTSARNALKEYVTNATKAVLKHPNLPNVPNAIKQFMFHVPLILNPVGSAMVVTWQITCHVLNAANGLIAGA